MSESTTPVSRPVTLTIAGSDSGGGAGIQADVKTMEANGVFATSAITAVTAQNTQGVASSYVLPVDEISAQITAVQSDFDVQAVKTGMLATEPVIELVSEYASRLSVPLVVDPVMVAATGDRLLDPEAEDAYEKLIAQATLVTPNANEAEVLTGTTITTVENAVNAGEQLLETGVNAVLVKGGHIPGDKIKDVLVTPDDTRIFDHPRIETDANHGSGCMLASAITARLAFGDSLTTAVQRSISLVERAIKHHHDVGNGPGAVTHMVAVREDENSPHPGQH